MSWNAAAALIAILTIPAGCITRAGGALSPLQLPAEERAATLEYTVGDFEFSLEGGKMVTSNKAGRELNEQILGRWKKNGWISAFSYAESSRFTGNADYQLVLSGSQYGDSSIAAQILSGLTLLLLPYSVDTSYDVQYTLEKVATGERYSAGVADGFHTTVELLLMFAAPVSMRGLNATMDAMSDHLYQQLRDEGAFEPGPAGSASPPSQRTAAAR
jgi:hypothetical protein